MELASILPREAVFDGVSASCGKQLLQNIAAQAAKLTQLPAADIFEKLIERERLGSTAVGHGAAIPHTRLAGLKAPLLLFSKLSAPIAMDTPDEEPVDLVFCLLVPEQTNAIHLKVLARLSKILASEARRKMLRDSIGSQALYDTILGSDHPTCH